jgi:pilus assembly protein CpaE
MATNGLWIRIEARSNETTNWLERIICSIKGVKIQGSDDTRHTNLLIYELGKDVEKEFLHIESLIHAKVVDEIFLTSSNTDRGVLMQAMRSGVKEFLSQPLDEAEVKEALERFKKRQEKSDSSIVSIKPGHVINVVGTKGGVGTTTVAVNLAVSLAERKDVKSVALIDLNMLFGEVPLFLEIDPKHDLSALTNQIARLDSTFLMSILSKSSTGVHVLPSPRHFNSNESLDPKMMDRILELMTRMFDFIVIDGGQPLNQMSLKLLATSDTVLLVSVLTLPCLSNTDKLLRSLLTLGYPVDKLIKVVINRYLKNSEIALNDAEDAINKKIFWTIPNDYRTTLSAINQGKPLAQIAQKAAITKNFVELADRMVLGEAKEEKKWWSPLKKSDPAKRKHVNA